MKAEIKDEKLIINPENDTEQYAMAWFEDSHKMKCGHIENIEFDYSQELKPGKECTNNVVSDVVQYLLDSGHIKVGDLDLGVIGDAYKYANSKPDKECSKCRNGFTAEYAFCDDLAELPGKKLEEDFKEFEKECKNKADEFMNSKCSCLKLDGCDNSHEDYCAFDEDRCYSQGDKAVMPGGQVWTCGDFTDCINNEKIFRDSAIEERDEILKRAQEEAAYEKVYAKGSANRIIDDAKEQAEKIIKKAHKEGGKVYDTLVKEVHAKGDQIIAEAKEKADMYMERSLKSDRERSLKTSNYYKETMEECERMIAKAEAEAEKIKNEQYVEITFAKDMHNVTYRFSPSTEVFVSGDGQITSRSKG